MQVVWLHGYCSQTGAMMGAWIKVTTAEAGSVWVLTYFEWVGFRPILSR